MQALRRGINATIRQAMGGKLLPYNREKSPSDEGEVTEQGNGDVMKMCHRCGEQTDLYLVDLCVYKNFNRTDCQYKQLFNLCPDCLDTMFNRLSMVLSDSRKWKPSEED